ncbi:hypothetical protein D6853_08575 [Butyrivibrio sp. X503]|uniref:hypothetical protein n=1 Tax=Butyrivibrio sp. X503 TaxID=2364878 RepID=UPI000EA9B41C|nr:hypothetical protein [Butyrivibrio sp. X503]RKM55600.1 hypothetical protein D6853_08575 [Butyrivibrio sp. X503]
MKKLSTIAISTAMVFALMGCGASGTTGETTGGDETASTLNYDDSSSSTDAGEVKTELSDDQFMCNGKAVSILDDKDTIMEKLGDCDPERTTIREDRGDYCFKESEIHLTTLTKDGTEYPIEFYISQNVTTTARGIKIGSSTKDIEAAYGEPNVEPERPQHADGTPFSDEEIAETIGKSYIYDLGDIQLAFGTEDDKVTAFTYQNKENHDKFEWN